MASALGPYVWQPFNYPSSAFQAFPTNADPPYLKIALPVPVSFAGNLRRTHADLTYSIRMLAEGDTPPPAGSWAEFRVTACLWVDPSGDATAADVPYPFTQDLPPFPIWQGLLYPTYQPFAYPDAVGWVASYRPLASIDSEAQRAGTGVLHPVPVTWLSLRAQSPFGEIADGLSNRWKLQFTSNQLFQEQLGGG